MPTVAEHLDHNRRELLDLSTRNRLLSIPKASKSARLIHIVDELSVQIYRILTEEKKSMTFLAGRDSGELDLDDADSENLPSPHVSDSNGDAEGVAKRHVDSRLQTGLTPDGLQRRLLALYTDAKTVEEEQGVNVLFLGLGQLEWIEDNGEQGSRFAPILLLPVELVRASAAEKFKLQWTEQELQENLSLSAKLLNDFDVEMPPVGDQDDFNLEVYFSAIAEAVKDHKTWKVLPNEITLGLFSFAKLMMHRDLDPENWPNGRKIDENQLISRLLIDGFDKQDPLFTDNCDLDTLIPVDRLDHVMDADGSQAAVIEVARGGRNLVVQGPPGTGKSQTICNILASAVLDGKKVLFVAEKQAALEVVKRRLEAIHLGDLCLELHSNKANKKKILQDLGRTWSLGRPRDGDHVAAFAKLDRLRTRLNSHCALLHRVLEPSGLTPFQIIGALAALKDFGSEYKPLHLTLSRSWSKEIATANRRLVLELAERASIVGTPSRHPWRGCRRKHFLRIDAEPLRQSINEATDAVSDLVAALDALSGLLGEARADSAESIPRLLLLADHIACAPDLDREAICSSVWDAGLEGLRDAIASGRKLNEIRDSLSEEVVGDPWVGDLRTARIKISEHGQSLFRVLNREYREAFNAFRSVLSEKPPGQFDDRLALLNRIIEGQDLYRKVEGLSVIGAPAFGKQWRGHMSDWDKLDRILLWVSGHKAVGLEGSFRKLVSTVPNKHQVSDLAAKVRSISDLQSASFESLSKALTLDCPAAFGTEQIQLPFADLQDRLDLWVSSFDSLPDWISYNTKAEALSAAGATSVVVALALGEIPCDKLAAAFDWAYLTGLLRDLVESNPDLGTFDGLLHGRTVEQFREADRNRLEIAKLRTLAAHYQQMPPEGEGVGVTGIVKGEMARKRGHMPIRKLLKMAGKAIQGIKPIFMMSPLSVAQYLEPGAIDFDLLVIDEASQVEPVDALGAVARCKQVVVVGDSQQLPPSRFFMRMTTESDDEDFDPDSAGASAKDIESILGLCLSKGIPQKTLRWHYRSRHHSLIAVSNHEFYESGLFIVPSPHAISSELGLRFRFVPEGVFDSGKTAINRIEAQAVAEAVIAHAIKHPDTTLGVAAFSIKQRQAIMDELELMRQSNPDAERFLNDHPNEPFFVKNLENVQGDERDVIFISIGYARDATGYLAMRFGPLSIEGGERRLNVLISRAKKRCEIFSSIRSDDIDLNRASGRGVAALKSFLRYAETGRIGVARATGADEDSPFEEAVRSELEKHGLEVDTQVGEAGFFIDLAVRDPERKGSYILGIECDGAAYHSSRSARDRDRLRQAVLEEHGWLIHRIWSTDWLQRPDRELRNALIAVENARSSGGRGRTLPLATKVSEAEVERFQEEESDAPLYVLAQLDLPSGNFELHEMAPGQLIRHVLTVLEVEAPVHIDEVVLRIRSAWGYERAGNRIHELVEKATRLAIGRSPFKSEEGFLVNSARQPTPRKRDDSLPLSLRKPENLPPSEIRAAILVVVERHLGVGSDELDTAVARLFGFKATSQQIRSVIQSQVRKLVRNGILSDQGGTIQRATRALPGTQTGK